MVSFRIQKSSWLMLDKRKIKVIAFDCVNTVFDVSCIGAIGMRAYIDQIQRPRWAPLVLPPEWESCIAHPDSPEGIARLSIPFVTATCSNWPAYALAQLSEKSGIVWSAIIPMEQVQCYKPNSAAYLNVPKVLNVESSQVLMVTANETAPDIESARSLGMQTILIDRENKYEGKFPRTIIELAEVLEC